MEIKEVKVSYHLIGSIADTMEEYFENSNNGTFGKYQKEIMERDFTHYLIELRKVLKDGEE